MSNKIMKKLETRFVWVPGKDGTIIYVKETWKSKFFGVTKQQNLAMFYADSKYGQQCDYKTAVNLAKDYIKRLNRSKPMADDWKNEYIELLHDYKYAVNMGYDDEVKQYQYVMDQLVEMMYKSDEKD